jgi:hypothetical protein
VEQYIIQHCFKVEEEMAAKLQTHAAIVFVFVTVPFLLGTVASGQSCPSGHASCGSFQKLRSEGVISSNDIACFSEKTTFHSKFGILGPTSVSNHDTFDVFSVDSQQEESDAQNLRRWSEKLHSGNRCILH